jgi:hypothetical protein
MKRLTPALFLLVSSFAACGRTDSVLSSAVGTAGGTAAAALATPSSDADRIKHWCEQRLGTYYPDNSVCRIVETQQFSLNWHLGTASMNLPVYKNDTVTIRASGSPTAYIGGESYPANSTFVAQADGDLLLNGRGYKVSSIQLTRCYNQFGYSVQCP